MKRIPAFLFVLILASPAAAADWPQFRGPGGLGVSAETGLPTRWSATENILWKTDLPGRGLSSPVIVGGRVYVTACTGPDQDRLHVFCFEAASGKKLWQRQFWATGTTLCHPKTNMAAPTPVADGKCVYALFATCDLACLSADGDLLWYRSLTRDYPTIGNNVGMASSLALAKSGVIVPLENAGESYTLGIDKRTGKNRWQIERSREINWASPILISNNGREEMLMQSSKEVMALDPENGRKRWNHLSSGLSTIPSAAYGEGLVFIPGNGILALRPGGESAPAKAVWQKGKLTSAFASPLYHRGHLYTLNNVGVLSCTQAISGNLLWQLRLKGAFSASPVAADGKIYLTNENGTTFVVAEGKTGTVLATNELADTFLATPALADGAIYLRSDKYLYCVNAKKK